MIHIRQVERTFVVLSLVLLAVFYFSFLFVSPVKFLDAEFWLIARYGVIVTGFSLRW